MCCVRNGSRAVYCQDTRIRQLDSRIEYAYYASQYSYLLCTAICAAKTPTHTHTHTHTKRTHTETHTYTLYTRSPAGNDSRGEHVP
jgi:hypothetical protein